MRVMGGSLSSRVIPCREALTGSAHQVKGPDRGGPRQQEISMPKHLAKPDIVTPEQWRAAREALLEQEKAHTRARDALAAQRRRMPMIRVQKDYRFTAPGGGDATLLDLFDGSRQLVVYRFFMRTPLMRLVQHRMPVEQLRGNGRAQRGASASAG